MHLEQFKAQILTQIEQLVNLLIKIFVKILLGFLYDTASIRIDKREYARL